MEATSFPEVFSVQAFPFEFTQWNGEKQLFTYYAVAVNGEIAWDEWPDGSKVPFLWATKPEELQEMIEEKENCLLSLLREETPEEKQARIQALLADRERLRSMASALVVEESTMGG